jgi:hypothetical protein
MHGKEHIPQELPEPARSTTSSGSSSGASTRWLNRLGYLERVVIYYATYFAFGRPFRVEEVCSFVVYALRKMSVPPESVFDSHSQLYRRVHAACRRLAYPCREKRRGTCGTPQLLIHNPKTKTYQLNPEYHDVGSYIDITKALERLIERRRRSKPADSGSDPGKERVLRGACCGDAVLSEGCPRGFYDAVFRGEANLIRVAHCNARSRIQVVKLVALMRYVYDTVFEQLARSTINRGELSRRDIMEIDRRAKELAEEVRRAGKACFGYHKAERGRNREGFSPLMPYTTAIALYGERNVEPGVDISIPRDVGRRIEEFLGFRPFEKSYLVTQEHLVKTGAMRRWRERRALTDYTKRTESQGASELRGLGASRVTPWEDRPPRG